MNKTRLVEKIADKAGLTKAQARRVLRIVEAALVPAPKPQAAVRRRASASAAKAPPARARAAKVVKFRPGKI